MSGGKDPGGVRPLFPEINFPLAEPAGRHFDRARVPGQWPRIPEASGLRPLDFQVVSARNEGLCLAVPIPYSGDLDKVRKLLAAKLRRMADVIDPPEEQDA